LNYNGRKKLDLNSIIGFVLIFGILIWIMYQNQPNEKEIAAEKAKKEQVAKAAKAKEAQVAPANFTAPIRRRKIRTALHASIDFGEFLLTRRHFHRLPGHSLLKTRF
jgi:hypothetical protein